MRSGHDPQKRFHPLVDWTTGWSWLRNGPNKLESQLVHQVKYGGDPRLAAALGHAMADEWEKGQQALDGLWAVIPIPLHKRRQRQRGYNQSQALAEGWCQRTGMVQLHALVRPHSGRSLTRQHRRERIQNTRGLYAISPSFDLACLQPLAGCLLLDDVVTTGSTLEAAHSALRVHWKGPIGFITLLDAAR